jgi:hypothetical protein
MTLHYRIKWWGITTKECLTINCKLHPIQRECKIAHSGDPTMLDALIEGAGRPSRRRLEAEILVRHQLNVRHCHVWTAPADQGFFCGVAFDRGCGHVFGLLMRVMTPVGPDIVR